VVETNHSLEAISDSGEPWAAVLLDLRAQIYALTDPANKPATRTVRGRQDGRLLVKPRTGQVRYRSLTLDTRRALLRRYLQATRALQALPASPIRVTLSWDELEAIRYVWRYEEHDWADSISALYAEEMGAPPPQPWRVYGDQVIFNAATKARLVAESCARHIPPDLTLDLAVLTSPYYRPATPGAFNRRLRAILRKDRRSDAEAWASLRAHPRQLTLPLPAPDPPPP
jgi:hypothetical protein